MHPVAALVLALVLSGCVGPNQRTGGIGESPEPPRVHASLWDDCKGVFVGHSFVQGFSPAQAAPGWENSEAIEIRVFTEVLDCHFVVGRFDGRALMVIESHTNLKPPEGCREEAYGFGRFIRQIIVNNTLLAQELGVFGFSPKVAMIEHNQGNVSGEANWSLNTMSSTVHYATLDRITQVLYSTRYFHWNGTHVVWLDAEQLSRIAARSPLTWGSYSEEMLAPGPFAAIGSVLISSKIAIDFETRRGLDCQ